jgi:hypothetical protein
VILCSGKKKDWIAWKEKFLAKVILNELDDILLEKVTIHPRAQLS